MDAKPRPGIKKQFPSKPTCREEMDDRERRLFEIFARDRPYLSEASLCHIWTSPALWNQQPYKCSHCNTIRLGIAQVECAGCVAVWGCVLCAANRKNLYCRDCVTLTNDIFSELPIARDLQLLLFRCLSDSPLEPNPPSYVSILRSSDQGWYEGVFSNPAKAREYFLRQRVAPYFQANPQCLADWKSPLDPDDDELCSLLDYFDWEMTRMLVSE